jgi:hypothetical protein
MLFKMKEKYSAIRKACPGQLGPFPLRMGGTISRGGLGPNEHPSSPLSHPFWF